MNREVTDMTLPESRNDLALRRVSRVIKGMPATDGAGVELTRVIGQPALPMLDPFLLLDSRRTLTEALRQLLICLPDVCAIKITLAMRV